MAVNYGSNSLKTTGDIIGAQGQPSGRTLYFNGGDFATVGNFYTDAAKTIVSSSVPTSEDTVILDGSANLSSCSTGDVIAHTIILRDTATISVSNNISVKFIALYDTSYLSMSGGYLGNSSTSLPTVEVKLYDDSYLDVNGLDVNGSLYFYDNADTFDGSSYSANIKVYGNVYVQVSTNGSGGYSRGFRGSSGGTNYSNIVYGDVFVSSTYGGSRILLAYCDIYGSVNASHYAGIENCNFYGGNIFISNYSSIEANTNFYGCLIRVFGDGFVGGGGSINLWNNSILRLDYDGYFTGSLSFYLNDSSKLILNGNNASGASLTITGDSDQSRVEVHQNFGSNGMGTTSTITCGTLAFYGSSYLTTDPTITANRVEFYDESYLDSADTLNIVVFNDKSYCDGAVTVSKRIEFNDESYNISTTVYGDGSSNPIAIFNHNSYNNGALDSNFDVVTFNGSSTNTYSGTGVNGDTIFNDFAKNDSGATVGDDAVFNDFSVNDGTISGDAVFNGQSTNNGTVSNNATFTGLSAQAGTVSGSLIYRNVPTELTPSSFSSTQNDYDPGYGDVLRLEATSANQDITGLMLRDRYLIVIVNIGSTYNITLKHEDSNSTASNRFLVSTGSDHVIAPNGIARLLYDSISSRWRVL